MGVHGVVGFVLRTAAIDIYPLGVIYIECLQEFDSVGVRRAKYPQWHQ